MSRIRQFVLLFVVIPLLFVVYLSPSHAQALVKGLVVDRTDKELWLGFPVAVQQNALFNVMLVPGNSVIAQATVVQASSDAPYVARATYVLVDPKGFVPVGAYVEAAGEALPGFVGAVADDRDTPDGFKEPKLYHEDRNAFSLNAGVFFPIDSPLRDQTTPAWLALEVRYRIAETPSSNVGIVAGFYGDDGNFTTTIGGVPVEASRNVKVYPISIDAKFYTSGEPYQGWFVRGGIGAYIIDDDQVISGVVDDTTYTTLGWQAGAGYESRSGLTAQLYYTDVSKGDFQGIVFSVGARF